MSVWYQSYSPQYLPAIISLLQRELPAHTITPELFAQKVLLDANFDPDMAIVATDAGEVVGFLLALNRRTLTLDEATDRHRGWITLFAVSKDVRRTECATGLFDLAEQQFRNAGITEVWISPYTPNYWTPGVDEDAYPAAIAHLKGRGYAVMSRPIGMELDLTVYPAESPWVESREQVLGTDNHLKIAPISPEMSFPLTQFLATEFPGDWRRHLGEAMQSIFSGYRPPGEILVATVGDKVWGFTHADQDRFGPFGVADSKRGMGIGAVLLHRALLGMQARGARKAWFMWTGEDQARRVYAPAGFVGAHRYSVFMKRL